VVVDAAARDALVAAGATPQAAPPAASASRWLTLVGAGAATAGFVTAMAGGVAFAGGMQADASRVIDDEWPALAGFVGGVGLFVVGGGLIVVDQHAD
jgi:hypothetical protein